MSTRVTNEEGYREHLKKLGDNIEKKNGKSLEQLYKEKQKRLWDVIEMKEPDKVPVIVGGSYFAAKHAGLPYSVVYYDAYAFKAAFTGMVADYEPDTWGEAMTSSGAYLDLLGAKNTLWPGGTLPEDAAHQAVDDEYMKEDEYDHFLEDITDFITRCYLPRVYTSLEPLSRLSPISVGMGGLGAVAPMFGTDEFREVGQVLSEAGEEQSKWFRTMTSLNEDLESLGVGDPEIVLTMNDEHGCVEIGSIGAG